MRQADILQDLSCGAMSATQRLRGFRLGNTLTARFWIQGIGMAGTASAGPAWSSELSDLLTSSRTELSQIENM